MTAADTAPGYEILGRIATGGMAEIFLARNVSMSGVSRYCVIKRILQQRAGERAFVEMFLDEARLAANLRHPNVAQVLDIGKLGNSYFFSMEYVHGETVRAVMQRAAGSGAEIPLAVVLSTIAGVASGLHHAHTRVAPDGRPLHIVHRDVSPSNLMISYEGGVKVVDFGVAQAARSRHETEDGTVKGKVGYLSPEQARGQEIDRRSDLFSLGIVMWEMLTGGRLFKRGSAFKNMQAIVSERTDPPTKLRAEIPRDIEAVVMKLLEKDRSRRYQHADEVVDAIEACAARNRLLLSASVLARFMAKVFGTRSEPRFETTRRYVSVTADAPTSSDTTTSPEEHDLRLAGVPSLDVERDEEAITGEVAPTSRTDPRRFLTSELRVLDGLDVPVARAERGRTLLNVAPPPGDYKRNAVAVAPRRLARGTPELTTLTEEPSTGETASAWTSLRPRRAVAVAWLLAAIALCLLLWLVLRPATRRTPASSMVADAAPAPSPDAAVDAATPDGEDRESLQWAFARQDYRAVVALCTADPETSEPGTCVRAACQLGAASTARTFFRKTDKSERRQLIAACREDDVELVRRKREPAASDEP